MSTPTLACGTSGQTYINIVVTAGATGAPAGFTVQWETAEDFAAYGWNSSSAPSYCDASFSGNAADSIYSLAPSQSITVNIGDNTFDLPGASTSCPGAALQCGHSYVFRVFAHATSTLRRSDFSATLACSTLSCTGGGCTYTQGYWKTHGPGGVDACTAGNNSDVWPASALPMLLGNVPYTGAQLCTIFNTAGAGNGLITLAHQLIAAKLNIAAGADPTAVAAAISSADALIGNLVVPPTDGSTDSLANSATSALTATLTDYNEGDTGPGHCE